MWGRVTQDLAGTRGGGQPAWDERVVDTPVYDELVKEKAKGSHYTYPDIQHSEIAYHTSDGRTASESAAACGTLAKISTVGFFTNKRAIAMRYPVRLAPKE